VRISDEILTRQQDSYRKFRNTMRHMLGNIADFGPKDAVAYDDLWDIDKWALHKMQLLKERVLKAYNDYEFHIVYHALHNFCAVDISSLYLDVLKDRLYTFAKDSKDRRAAQTALAEILTDLLKLLAPVLVYTADEAWGYLPEHLRREQSVHLAEFPSVRSEYKLSPAVAAEWDTLLRVRAVASKQLEEARRAEMIGSSLQASLTITPGDDATASALKKYEGQLYDLMIVSHIVIAPASDEARATEEKVLVTVAPAPGEKCVRCWHVRESVGTISGHQQICAECAKQLGVG
jgi:isoleucyl-tRNA synthetase